MPACAAALRRTLALVLFLHALLVASAAWAAPKAKDAGAPDAGAHDAAAASAPSASAEPPPSASASAALPAPSQAPSASPSSAASAAPPPLPRGSAAAAAGAMVRIHDRKVFPIKVPLRGLSPEQRAKDATLVLERVVDEPTEPEITVKEGPDSATIYAGSSAVLELGPADAVANGDVSLSVHAALVASKIHEAIGAERKRSEIATTVFSVAMLVLAGLVAFLVLRKLGDLVGRGRAWIVAHPDRLPQLRVAGIEILRAASLRGGLLVVIDGAQWLLRLGVAYAWLLFALSRFDATREFGERLGGIVLAPFWALIGRAASALPLLVVAGFAGIAVGLLLRFVALFFASVGRGETTLAWVPSDLAAPTSVLVRAGIVLAALVLASPLVTGSEDGSLARAGIVALVAVGLAATPLLACGAVGVVTVFGRKLHPGDFVEVGGRSGIVRSMSLLEVCIEDADGCEVRVPHLASLVHATRVLGASPPVAITVTVSPAAPHGRVVEMLAHTATAIGERPRVELAKLDADGAHYEVVVFSGRPDARTRLFCAVAEALAKSGVALGRSAPKVSPP